MYIFWSPPESKKSPDLSVNVLKLAVATSSPALVAFHRLFLAAFFNILLLQSSKK